MSLILVNRQNLILEAFEEAFKDQIGIYETIIYDSLDEFSHLNIDHATAGLIIWFFYTSTSELVSIEAFKARCGGRVHIIRICDLPSFQLVTNLIHWGTDGILSSGASLKELKDAIDSVMKGWKYVGQDLQGHMLDNIVNGHPAKWHLTAREHQVLTKVCSGRTIKEIAYDMQLSSHTVQYYYRGLMAKFRVHRIADLVMYAATNGFYIG